MALICQNCSRLSDCAPELYCPNCGQRKWRAYTSIKDELSQLAGRLMSGLLGIVGMVFSIALGLAVLWGLVAVVHWMWNHS